MIRPSRFTAKSDGRTGDQTGKAAGESDGSTSGRPRGGTGREGSGALGRPFRDTGPAIAAYLRRSGTGGQRDASANDPKPGQGPAGSAPDRAVDGDGEGARTDQSGTGGTESHHHPTPGSATEPTTPRAQRPGTRRGDTTHGDRMSAFGGRAGGPHRATARQVRPVRVRMPGLMRRRKGSSPKVVALGGGRGLSASLAALRRITDDLTAVVTVADDGGSSGRLRDELGVLPPGDLRKALAALCGDDEWGHTWSEVIQHRFTSKGELHDHAVGNLLIVALWEQLNDHVAALDLVGRLLRAHGRVLPMSAVPLHLEAIVRGHDPARPDQVSTVRGQATVALTPGEVQEVRLVPHDPPAVPEAVAAVLDADWVVLGPGSWFSSVMPHLLVPQLADALMESKARRVLTLNLAPQPGETEGFSPQRHLEVLAGHAPKLAIDVVLADEAAIGDRASLRKAAERLRGTVWLAPVAAAPPGRTGDGPGEAGSARHDPELLAAAYDRIFRMHGRIGSWR